MAALNEHQGIVGARDLSPADVELMNEIKMKGEEFSELLNRVDLHLLNQRVQADNVLDPAKEKNRLDVAQPLRWLAMARSDLQTGIMKLVRAVAQPSSF